MWNTIWDGDRLEGLIDWDFAEPAPPLWDLAQAAWYGVPFFRREDGWKACGFATSLTCRTGSQFYAMPTAPTPPQCSMLWSNSGP